MDIGHKGLKDDEIFVLLRRQRNPTFFTRDADFYLPTLRHRSHCVVVLSVGQYEVATFIRRFLRHADFDTQAKRMGRVVRVSHVGVALWRLRSQREIHTGWSGSKLSLPAIVRDWWRQAVPRVDDTPMWKADPETQARLSGAIPEAGEKGLYGIASVSAQVAVGMTNETRTAPV